MPRFVGRPVVVEAHCFRGTVDAWPELFRIAVLRHIPGGITEIRTPDGPRACRHGDWIVRGPSGQFTVMREADFETYFDEQHPPATVARRKEMVNGR